MICHTIHIIGFPSLYGGAGAELYHQIPVWEKLGVKLHFIPTQKNVKGAALENGVTTKYATYARKYSIRYSLLDVKNHLEILS